MIGYVEQLRAAGIRVLSHQKPWLDTGGPIGELVLAIFAWVAKQERERIGEWVRAGQTRLELRASTSDVVHGWLTWKKSDAAVWLDRGGDASQKR
jgi:DNA invertase Pin-like site-specific DNA recombinase